MDLLKVVEQKLSGHDKRITHVKGVLERAIELHGLYGGDIDAIKTAALLHDICKYDDIEVQIDYIKDETLIKRYANTKVMYHALAAAYYVKDILKIENDIVFEAIAYHIWGKIDMRLETMIIVVADFCEPNRAIPEAKMVYEVAKGNLLDAYLLSLEYTINYLIQHGKIPHQEQLDAIAFYKEIR